MTDIEGAPAQADMTNMLKGPYAWERSDLLWNGEVRVAADSTLGHSLACDRGLDRIRLQLLSEREAQVVGMAAHGRTNKIIAYELGLAHATVRVLMARAAAKVGVRSRAELIERYRDQIAPARCEP